MKIEINFGFVFLVFLVLKLTEHITWSWWWITSPIWIGFIIWLIIGIFGLYLTNSKSYQQRKMFNRLNKK